MDNILKLYRNNHHNRELEIRFTRIDRDKWITLYENVLKLNIPVNVHKIISMIKSNGDIRNSFYNNTTKIFTEFINKQRLYRESIDGDCKLVLSNETPIQMSVFRLQDNPLIRLKIRHSFIYQDMWSIDATIVHVAENDAIKSIVQDFFKDHGNQSIIEFSKDKPVDYEFEIEYKGLPNQLTAICVKNVVNVVRGDNRPNIAWLDINRPKPITIKDYSKVYAERQQYYISAKIDGVFAVVLINNIGTFVYKDEVLTAAAARAPPELGAPLPITTDAGDMLFQVECAEKMYIIDVFMFKGVNVRNSVFIDRYKCASDIVELAPEMFAKKEQLHLTPDAIDKIIAMPNQDGIIFNKNTSYSTMSIWKWKPASMLTIDFLIINPNPEKFENVYHLYCNITKSLIHTFGLEKLPYYDSMFPESGNYVKIQFSPFLFKNAYIWQTSEKGLHNRNGEFLWDKTKWNLKVIDKTKINDFLVADTLFTQQYNPITLQYIKQPVDVGYFNRDKDNKYRQQTRFISHVRQMLYKQIANKSNILVLAAGKGQEVFIANQTNAKNIVYCDVDFPALMELINRLHVVNVKKYYPDQRAPQTFGKNYVAHIDLTQHYKINVKKIVDQTAIEKFDAIMINLALHYLMTSPEATNNIISLIDTLLNEYGIVCFTGFNGELIYDRLKTEKEYKVMHSSSNELLYHIIADFKDSKSLYDQKIKVLLPFSTSYYQENLLNFTEVIEKFTALNYELRQYGSVHNFLHDFLHDNRDRLSDEDIDYIKLIYYTSMWKKSTNELAKHE
jgi:hypothetical protein